MIGLAVRDVLENIGLCRSVAKEQDERNQFVISVWQLRSCQDRVYAMDFSTEHRFPEDDEVPNSNLKCLFELDLPVTVAAVTTCTPFAVQFHMWK